MTEAEISIAATKGAIVLFGIPLGLVIGYLIVNWPIRRKKKAPNEAQSRKERG
jgi:Na+/glutamate symporter